MPRTANGRFHLLVGCGEPRPGASPVVVSVVIQDPVADRLGTLVVGQTDRSAARRGLISTANPEPVQQRAVSPSFRRVSIFRDEVRQIGLAHLQEHIGLGAQHSIRNR